MKKMKNKNHIHYSSNGEQIMLKDLHDNHLDNIIMRNEKWAINGVLVGFDFYDPDSHVYGKEALEHLNHFRYVKEKERREKKRQKEEKECIIFNEFGAVLFTQVVTDLSSIENCIRQSRRFHKVNKVELDGHNITVYGESYDCEDVVISYILRELKPL